MFLEGTIKWDSRHKHASLLGHQGKKWVPACFRAHQAPTWLAITLLVEWRYITFSLRTAAFVRSPKALGAGACASHFAKAQHSLFASDPAHMLLLTNSASSLPVICWEIPNPPCIPSVKFTIPFIHADTLWDQGDSPQQSWKGLLDSSCSILCCFRCL